MSTYSKPFEDEKQLRDAISRSDPIVRNYIADIEEYVRVLEVGTAHLCGIVEDINSIFNEATGTTRPTKN